MSDNTKGLYKKFIVTRTDGASGPGMKHEDCSYFVLDLDHDPYAKAALTMYALACAETHPQLSKELLELVR
jgi:hypothetical protein